jgi:transcriptional regulator with XRE-family HTH domain
VPAVASPLHPLRVFRRAKGLTLRQLSRRARIDHTTICRIERGMAASREHVTALARAMRVSPDELERAFTSEGFRVA